MRTPTCGVSAPERRSPSPPKASPTSSITATPCRHGAPFTRPIVGPAIGFTLGGVGAAHPALWMTGDTVMYRALRRVAIGMHPEVALVHIGAVRFPLTGPLAYTMDADDAVELIALAEPGVAVPVHVEGWSHFSQQEDAAAGVLDAAPGTVRERVRWAPLGEPIDLPPVHSAARVRHPLS